jgi:IS1 family transposase
LANQNRTQEIALKNPDAGDVWLWTAICADSKLVLSWRLGQRDLATAKDFVGDLASRLCKRVQITSDGHKAYLEAVEDAFGADSRSRNAAKDLWCADRE